MKINGKNYTAKRLPYDPALVRITGPGIVGGFVVRHPEGESITRELVTAAVEQAGRNRQAASEYIRERTAEKGATR
jgi:hypothetical protein